MTTNNPPRYDTSLIGVMSRLTHGILLDANERAMRDGTRADPPARSPMSRPASAPAGTRARSGNWLDRLDNWFWKQEMKSREAFLARSIDVFDLEQRMRCLERGDKWLGTDRTGTAR